jgi:hypothetical protein
MKRLLIIAVVLSLGAITFRFSEPLSGDARIKKCFGSERKAETRLDQRFSDVRSAEAWVRLQLAYDPYGQQVFTAFYCSGGLTDGSDYQITMYTPVRIASSGVPTKSM